MAFEMQAGGKRGKKRRSQPEMNVTPLVDVVLVLLIIFMVITPMMHEHFWVLVPEKVEADQPAATNGPLVITVAAEGGIRINKLTLEDDAFPTKLRRMLAAKRSREVVFDAHDDVPAARALTVMDWARGAGAAHIAVATEALR